MRTASQNERLLKMKGIRRTVIKKTHTEFNSHDNSGSMQQRGATLHDYLGFFLL